MSKTPIDGQSGAYLVVVCDKVTNAILDVRVWSYKRGGCFAKQENPPITWRS